MRKENFVRVLDEIKHKHQVGSDKELLRAIKTITGESFGQSTLSKYRNDLTREVSPKFIAALALTLDLKTSELFNLIHAYSTDMELDYKEQVIFACNELVDKAAKASS